MENKKYKPVTFVNSFSPYYKNNKFQQNLLLRALSVTSDPKKLKEITGIRGTAELFRTLDKLAIRKEFHKELYNHGLTLDFIVGKLKKFTESSSDQIGLQAVQTLMRAIGIDRYEKDDIASPNAQSWEELLIEEAKKKEDSSHVIDTNFDDYNVKEPPVPENMKKVIEEEESLGNQVYNK